MAKKHSLTIMTYLVGPPLVHDELLNIGLIPVPRNHVLNELFDDFYLSPSEVKHMIQEEDTRLEQAIEQGTVFPQTTWEHMMSSSLFWICQFPAASDGARMFVSKATKANWIIEHSGPLLSREGEYLHTILQKRGYLAFPGNINQILDENDIQDAIEYLDEHPGLAEYGPPVEHPLKFLIWNCSGAASPGFRWNFKQLVTRCSPDIVAITETKISGKRARAICASLNFDRCFVADPAAFGGGLWLMWDSKTVRTCKILARSQQEIHATIESIHY